MSTKSKYLNNLPVSSQFKIGTPARYRQWSGHWWQKKLIMNTATKKPTQQNPAPVKQYPPKFKVYDKVICPPTHYGETEGTITRVERVYQKINQFTGKIDPKGLVTTESTIKSICLPYTFDGNTLTVHYPKQDCGTFVMKAHTDISVFNGYACVVKTPKILTQFMERRLILKQ